MEQTIRYGIIGFGVQGRAYAKMLTGEHAPKHCALSAISTTSPDKASAITSEFPGTTVYRDWKEMIVSGVCDAVIATVPHYLHHEISIFCMEQGMHILCEKPAGIRAKDVQKMLDCHTAHSKAAFGILFNQRAARLYQRLHQLLASGELGQLRRSNWIITTWWRPDSYYRQSPWRATWGGEGGGVLVNQAPHQLDLWQWLCGMPERITSVNINGAHRDIAVENDVTMIAEYPNGATGCFTTCTHDPIGTDRLEIQLDKGRIVVENGTKATVYRLHQTEDELNASMDMKSMAALTQGGSSGSGLYETETFEYVDVWGEQHCRVMENFARHILFGEPLIAPGEEGIRSVEIANASQLSSWLGKTVTLPVDPELYAKELNQRIAAEGKYPLR